MTSTKAKSLAFPALMGVRFVAAVHVITYHALRGIILDGSLANDHPWFAAFVGGASPAVTMFFVLSGFVLTVTQATSPAPSTLAFFRDRFARIAPAYGLALCVAVPIGAIARAKGIVVDAHPVLSLLTVTTAMQAWCPATALSWNPPAWSVSVELLFYVAFPWVVPRLLRMRRASAVLIAGASWALAVAVVAVACAIEPVFANARVSEALPDGSGSGAGGVDLAFWFDALKHFPLLRFPEFLVGVVAARFFLDDESRARIARIHWSVGVVVAGGCIALSMSDLLPQLVLHDALLALPFAIMVLVFAHGGGPVARLLSTKLAVLLGEASYPLYLLHVPVLYWTAAFLHTRALDPAVALTVAFLTVPVAVFALVVVERPLRARLRAPRRLRTPPPP